MSVEKTVKVFANFEDADEADTRHDAAIYSMPHTGVYGATPIDVLANRFTQIR